MFRYSNERVVPFPVRCIYNLILDVESYPNFIPWCHAVKIIDSTSDRLIVDTTIKFKLTKISYLSEVTSEFLDDSACIEVKGVPGLFKHLYSRWDLQALTTAECTKIGFYNSFSVKSGVFNSLINNMYVRAQKEVLSSFIERAAWLFGNHKQDNQG